jgi:sulfatase maturation enzyme AslB (radical SAM superfamily)
VLEIVDRLKPLHLSLVGGEPLVRYREVEVLVPLLMARGIHVQIVTSAFRPLPPEWAALKRMKVVVSIDGLAAEHDARRAPATYQRIMKNIAGQKVIIHCTVTGQMMKRSGYLEDFLRFWTPRPEVHRVWFSLFTPQVGARMPEMLTPEERTRVVEELFDLRRLYSKLDMREGLLRQFAKPPDSPEKCVFAQTTRTVSADLKTAITPCQLGGKPDCESCGCVAAMGFAAVAEHQWGGFVPVGLLYKASLKMGRTLAEIRNQRQARELLRASL